jgi:type I restriction enzyme R subunit
MTQGYNEDILIEQPAIELFRSFDWDFINCFDEFDSPSGSPLGRETKSEVVLISRLQPKLKELNTEASEEDIARAIEELTKDRSSLSLVNANREIYQLLKEGIKITDDANNQDESAPRIRVIDWNNPENNDFLLCSQFWIAGQYHTRRADLVGFVNGLPLMFIEFKSIHKNLWNAYNGNLRDYKDTIPHIFWYNAFIILSNGLQSRIGTLTGLFEHFAEWKKINNEKEPATVSLETILRGTCTKERLLDIIENFILYSEERKGLVKMVAKYHQYFGVNAIVENVIAMQKNKGRLGVFWHTQGSGKSYSMVFTAQKILRTLGSNYTFLVVTDREDLDDQIYKNFANAGLLRKKETSIRAQSSTHLQQLLGEDHRILFTMIHKFRTERGEVYPVISTRSDIIVMTDEAHRTQYDVLALNMRNALPNAAFVGFTGTPLIAGEERTKEVFGDYVSVYDFKQSIDDNATVPLYYENRIPELQIVNEALNDELNAIIEEAMLDEQGEKKLEREFSREYHILTRDDRLETIAEDIVKHFLGRGYQGKAMVVSIDRITAARMYLNVKKLWNDEIQKAKQRLGNAIDDKEQEEAQKHLTYLETTDMAVIISNAQNEIDDFKQKGIDILPIRDRLNKEALDEKFKDPDNPLRIVFVCAMWITGFDVPSCSTIYLDKPMKNHTLMQTIARCNRVFGEKQAGMIVDYVGIFRNLQKALAIYAGGGGMGELPIKEKQELVKSLKRTIEETAEFCESEGVTLQDVISKKGMERLAQINDDVEILLKNEETKKRYLNYSNLIDRLFKAILPDPLANEIKPMRDAIIALADAVKNVSSPDEIDISLVVNKIEAVLDRSIIINKPVVSDNIGEIGTRLDLSKIDFEKLRKQFEKSRKRTELEKLKGAVLEKILQLIAINKARVDFLERFKKMIEEYNLGSANVEQVYKELINLAQDLNEEERRHIKEELTEEELAIFDILMKPAPEMSTKERNQVKRIAKDLLETLKREKFSLDWRKRQQSRASVRQAIEMKLDELPTVFIKAMYEQKCNLVWQHVYDVYGVVA